MRIVAGSARGRRLKVPRTNDIRPTSDRLREALFSSLSELVPDSRFWDVCAGTGAVGIEALSRGAERCFFSESAREGQKLTRANLAVTGLLERADLFDGAWEAAVKQLVRRAARFDLIYFDPPYDDAAILSFLESAAQVVSAEGLVLVEHRRVTNLPEAGGFEVTRRLRAGSSSVTFYRRLSPEK